MGSVGGGGYIAIATALPPIRFRLLYCKHQIVYIFSLSCFFFAFLRLHFLDVETNNCPRCSGPAVCRILCSNVRGQARNLSDLTVASSQYDILLYSETLVLDIHHVSELLVPGFDHPILFCRVKMPRAQVMAANEILTRTRFISVTKTWVWLLRNDVFWGMWCETEPLCVQSLPQPRPRSLDFLLFTSINGCSSGWGYLRIFPFCGWFKWPSHEWLGSTTTTRPVITLKPLISQLSLVAIS